MRVTMFHTASTLVLLLGAEMTQAATPAASATAGQQAFREQCALCHSAAPNDNGGAQGPSLQGIFNNKAASSHGFSYTPALKASNLTWDAATLDGFLASPTNVVPGSSMVVAVPDEQTRHNLIAYFRALEEGTFTADARNVSAGRSVTAGSTPVKPDKGEADWKKDAPGRMHRIDLDKLPPPNDTPSITNFPRVVPRPADAKLSVPAGFKIETFADKDLQGPREMQVAPNGDIFLVETTAGRIKVLRATADYTSLSSQELFAQGLLQPYGMAFYPSGSSPQWLYVAEVNRVVRYPYKVGDSKATTIPEIVVPQLSPVGGGHFTRDIQFSPDGKTLYVSIGSQSNVHEDMPKKTAAEVREWEQQHGLGASWGIEENRATVMAFEVGSKKPGRIFATGIRNCVSLTLQPDTNELWCTTNERDRLGDDLVPDYSTRVKQGAFYGWPWYYMGDNVDPRHPDARPDLKGKVTRPDVPFTAHSAAVNLDFYTVTSGKSAFPAEFIGEGFAVLHGSWNRHFRTGHKVVRIKMKDGVPTGEYQDFLTGFIVDEASAWGRPVALVELSDGSLLLSDDAANRIYRISYSR